LTQTEKIIAFAKSKLGTSEYDGYCQRFVRLCYEAAGIYGSASTATDAWKKWCVSKSKSDIPVGAAVYFTGTDKNVGHVAIYAGDGYVYNPAKKVTYIKLSAIPGYRGWGWQGGIKPEGTSGASGAALRANELLKTGITTAQAAYKSLQKKQSYRTDIEQTDDTDEDEDVFIPMSDTSADENSVTVKNDDVYKIILSRNGESTEITELVGGLEWSESMDTVGVSFSFYVPDTVERYIPRLLIAAGDIVQVFAASGEIIRGVVVSVDRSFPVRTVRGYDFGFYLNKNDTVIQFKGKSVSECLKTLFVSVGISIGYVCDMPAKVKGVYIKNVNEIIKELIKIQQDTDGKMYYYEMRCDKVYVFEMPEEPLSYVFKPTVNVAAFDVTDKAAHSRGKYSHSMEDMKNCVIAEVSSKTSGEMPERQFIARDEESIAKYGLLAETYSVNSDEAEQIEELAKNELNVKNTVKREFSMDFVGHEAARAARVMHIEDGHLGINGDFRIQSVKHTVNDCVHTMNCVLEEI